ncbi:GntR family transcriptional regulator [Streptomyces sp. NPDC057877]|uniref:GntR family transcriptional regulator n=1 Tax=Streptomyces sp. NPDC057877 TaxID=3346269 RepID=UPI0036B3E27B
MAETAREIADELRERIRSGELRPGARLPGEPTLVKGYGVAKETARRALTLLVTEGLAVRRKGSGTYVREFQPIRRVANERLSQERWGGGRSIWSADAGQRPMSVTDLRVYEAPAPDHVAQILDLLDAPKWGSSGVRAPLGTAPAGRAAQQIVGHSDIGVTMKGYAHASLDEQRKALRRLGDTLS